MRSSASPPTSCDAIDALEHEAVIGRGARFAHDPDLPRQLPFDVRDLSLDPALDPGRRVRPHDERLDHQHHDARRLRARDRPPGRRLDGGAREHQPSSGRGQATADAARDGAEEVALPVLASTITTIIVFFPVMFLFGVAKYLFSALALAVVLSMIASYVVAMTRHSDLLRALSDRRDRTRIRGGCHARSVRRLHAGLRTAGRALRENPG